MLEINYLKRNWTDPFWRNVATTDKEQKCIYWATAQLRSGINDEWFAFKLRLCLQGHKQIQDNKETQTCSLISKFVCSCVVHWTKSAALRKVGLLLIRIQYSVLGLGLARTGGFWLLSGSGLLTALNGTR